MLAILLGALVALASLAWVLAPLRRASHRLDTPATLDDADPPPAVDVTPP